MRILLSTLFMALCCTAVSAQATLVKDIRTGSASSSPSEFAEFNGKLIFRATGDSLGQELYISDGTEAGTVMLKDINESTGSSSPNGFYRFNNQLYFQADNGSLGAELWVTDGTPEGTNLVYDATEGAFGSLPTDFIEFEGKLYFTASDTLIGGRPPQTNAELYRLSDSGDSVFIVKDLVEGIGSGLPADKLIFDNTLVFKGTIGEIVTPRGTVPVSGLWTSDGTADGTVKAPDATGSTDGVNTLQNLIVYQDKVYFSGSIPEIGRELFSYDGDSIRLVADLRKEPGISTNPTALVTFGDKLFFAGNTDTLGNELYMTDGTEAGTRILDINLGPACCGNPGTNNSRPGDFFKADGLAGEETLYFVAADTVADQYMALQFDGAGEPVFTSFRDLYGLPLTRGNDMISTGSTLYFGADTDEHGTELWKLSMIGNAIPERVSDLNPGDANSAPNDMILVGDNVLFYAQDSVGRELYGVAAERADYQIMQGRARILNDLDTIDVGTMFVGDSVDGAARIRSTGTGPNAAVIMNAALVANPFSIQTDDRIDSIPTGLFSDVLVTIAPVAAGDFLDSLHISVYGPNGPELVTIFLKVTAEDRIGVLEATANGDMLTGTEVVDFGEILNFQDSTIAVVLANTGTGPLLYTPSLRSGEAFTADDLDATQIAAGGMDTIWITFAPETVSAYEDTLVLALTLNADTNGELIVPLSGNAIVNSINNFGLRALNAFPNPTTDVLQIELAAPLNDATIRVFDVNGRRMSESRWPQGMTTGEVSLGNLPAGMYTVEVQGRTGRVLFEVVKR